MTTACILGCSGLELSAEERALYRDAQPWGFILFKRNLDTLAQIRDLVAAMRDCVGRPDAPVLIDQEGGRVQRLGPPRWPKYPPARAYGRIADPAERREITRLGARLIAHDLLDLGITVDCLPVLDTLAHGAHDAIGDRAYGDDWKTVAELGRAACEGLIAGGVLPVIKHIPGQGRSVVDSHFDLPLVDAALADLIETDFKPFQACSDMPMAMTCHVVFTAIDAERPATASPKVIGLIREEIGFDGLLMTDDISRKALRGPFDARAKTARAAGCDIVLHCNGDMDEMRAIVAGSGELTGDAASRAEAALSRIARLVEPLDEPAARARFVRAFDAAAAA